MKKLLGIMVICSLLSGNASTADNLMSILDVKLRDSINNYEITKYYGPDDMSKNIHSYSISAKIENKYFDNVLSIDTYGPQKKIYNIRAYYKKKWML